MCCSSQRLHDLGDESKLLPLWRQVSPFCPFHLRLINWFIYSLYLISKILLQKCDILDQFLDHDLITGPLIAISRRQTLGFFGTIICWNFSQITRSGFAKILDLVMSFSPITLTLVTCVVCSLTPTCFLLSKEVSFFLLNKMWIHMQLVHYEKSMIDLLVHVV